MQKLFKLLKEGVRSITFEHVLVALAFSLVLFASVNLIVQALRFQ
jgi:hypothetical protein